MWFCSTCCEEESDFLDLNFNLWETDQIIVSDVIIPHQKAPGIPNQLCLRLHQFSIQCWILSCKNLITLMPKQNHPARFLLSASEWGWNSSENSLLVYFGINRHLLAEDVLISVVTPVLLLCQIKYATDSQTGNCNFVLKGENAPKIWLKSLIFVHIMCTSKRQRSFRNLHSLTTLLAKSIKK